MSRVVAASSKPLPVVLRAARDELLSSWLSRHARFYGVTGPFFAKWSVLATSDLDARPSAQLRTGRSIDEKFRCDPVTLISMTQINTRDGQVCDLISRGRLSQICYPCADRYAQKTPTAQYQNIGARRGASRAPPAASPLRIQTSIAAVARRYSRRPHSKTYGRRPWQASKSSSNMSLTKRPPHTPRSQSCDCSWFRLGSQSQAAVNTLSSDGCWARFSQILTCARDRSSGVSHTRR